jgi:hypothetical protein
LRYNNTVDDFQFLETERTPKSALDISGELICCISGKRKPFYVTKMGVGHHSSGTNSDVITITATGFYGLH